MELGPPYLDGFEDNGGSGFVTGTGWGAGDGIDDMHSVDDFAKDGVAVVEPRGGFVGDKELATVGVWAGVGHAQDTGAIVCESGMKLVSEFVSRPTRSHAKRTTALDHKVLDDAVEGEAIVKRAVVLGLTGFGVKPFLRSCGKADKVGHGMGGLLLKEFDGEVAHAGVKVCIKSHTCFPFREGRVWISRRRLVAAMCVSKPYRSGS